MKSRSSVPLAALALLTLVLAAVPASVSAATAPVGPAPPGGAPQVVDHDLTSFHSLYPARIVDTRPGASTVDGQGLKGAPLGAGETYSFLAMGRGGIPAGLNGHVGTQPSAVLLNITALGATTTTHLTVWAGGTPKPTASNVNLAPGETIANLAVTRINGNDGTVDVFNNSGSTHVVVDVAGWFPTNGSAVPITPARLLDTRPGQPTVDGQSSGAGPIAGGGTLSLPVLSRGGVPASGVGAVIVNLTAVQPTQATHLTAFSSDASSPPNASNVNAPAGKTAANLVVVRPGLDGRIKIFNNAGNTDVVADVVAWSPTTGDLSALDPGRLVDTRPGGTTIDGQQAGGGPIGPGGTLTVHVLNRAGVPATGVGAVLLTITAVNPSTDTHLTIYPTGTTRPNASNVNLGPGQTRTNLAVAKPGNDVGGTVVLFNNAGSTNVVVDVAAWFPAVPSPPNQLAVTPVVGGLQNPWDIAFTPDTTMLFTQRSGKIDAFVGGQVRQLAAPSDIYVSGEAGMEGLAIDPSFGTNRRIYTCMASTISGHPDIRVVRWQVDAGYTTLTNRTDIVVAIPTFTAGTDFHAGCRPRFGPDGRLWVTTGDAGTGTNPQSKTSLSGKVLRVDTDGNGVAGNPGVDAPASGFAPQISTYGHRNPQGIAFQPGTGTPFENEHGPDQNDEVNVLQSGGNYGWDPVPGYNQAVPMTDKVKFPTAIDARWTTPGYTIAPSGSTFLVGDQWKSWNGAYVMAVLKGSMLRILTFNPDDSLRRDEIALTTLGRLRIATQGPDGDLYIAQDANPGQILRVHPLS